MYKIRTRGWSRCSRTDIGTSGWKKREGDTCPTTGLVDLLVLTFGLIVCYITMRPDSNVTSCSNCVLQ